MCCTLERRIGHVDVLEACARLDDALADLVVLALPALDVPRWIALVLIAAPHDHDAGRQVVRRAHFDRQAKAVEQLRAQVALLRIAAADEHESRRVTHAEAFTLDDVLAGGRDVEQQVDQVVLEQVHFVDVEEAAMGPRQQAGLEGLLALRQRTLEIERADDAVFGRTQRHVHDRDRRQTGPGVGRRATGPAFLAGLGRFRVTAVAARSHDAHFRQQRGKRTHRRRLAGATIAKDQHAADAGIDRCHEQRKLHFVLADDGTERKRNRHAGSFLSRGTGGSLAERAGFS